MVYPAVSSQNPNSRESFKQYCLRRLGAPVIEINVENDQVEDRIDDALQYWMDYHYDGTEKCYYKYQWNATDQANGYITLPDNIIGAVNIFDLGNAYGMNDMFNIRYQIALNDLYTLTSVSMVPYVMAMTQLQFLEEILIGKQPIRYNRYNNRLYIDTDWMLLSEEGNWLIVEAYSVIDPNVYTEAWSDRFLKRYATALIKKQWGENLKKYGNMQMPGGTVFNGQKIYDEATVEVQQLEHEMTTITLPAIDMIG